MSIGLSHFNKPASGVVRDAYTDFTKTFFTFNISYSHGTRVNVISFTPIRKVLPSLLHCSTKEHYVSTRIGQ